MPRTVYEHNALNAAFLFGPPSLPPCLSREPLSSRWLKKLIPFSRIKYVYSTCIFREHRVSSTTLVGRDHGCISLIQIWHGSKYRKHAFFFFFFVERPIPKIWLYIRNAIFFFLPPYLYCRSTSARTARTYTLCIMYGGALKIYKYESHGGVVSVTSCPERCSFIHTRKKFQP